MPLGRYYHVTIVGLLLILTGPAMRRRQAPQQGTRTRRLQVNLLGRMIRQVVSFLKALEDLIVLWATSPRSLRATCLRLAQRTATPQLELFPVRHLQVLVTSVGLPVVPSSTDQTLALMASMVHLHHLLSNHRVITFRIRYERPCLVFVRLYGMTTS